MGSRRDRSRSPVDRYNYGPPRGGGGRRKYQVIIKNLPFDVDWKRLKTFVKDEVGDVKYANVVDHRGRSAGFGFAEFGSEADMERCLQNIHRTKFGGRELHVFEDCDERELNKLKALKGIESNNGSNNNRQPMHNRDEQRRPPIRGGDREPTLGGVPVTSIPGVSLDDEILAALGSGAIGNSVFIHNLLFEITSGQLREVFSLAGQVLDVEMQKSGYAVIKYASAVEAVKAVVLFTGQELCGRKIMIKIDSAPPKPPSDRRPPTRDDDRGPRDHPPPRNNTWDDDGGGRNGGGSWQRNAPPPRDQYRAHAPPDYRSGPPPPLPPSHAPPAHAMRNKISIANLPLTVTTQTIRDLFERAGDVDYVQLSDGGRCDVEFFSEYSAAEAIAKFDKYLLDQSEIRVFRT